MRVPFSLGRLVRWTVPLAIALIVLNIGLAHQNLWPTPWIRVVPDISLELTAIVLLVATAAAFGWRPGARAKWGLAFLFLLLVFGRYVDVTAPALFGRRIDLYWDARHIPAVTGMVLEAWPLWQIVALVTGLALGFLVLLAVLRWCTGVICRAAQVPASRNLLIVGSAGLLVYYAIGMESDAVAWEKTFALPVTPVYVDQVQTIRARLMAAVAGEAETELASALRPPAPLQHRDVYVLFLESYGRIAYDDPAYAGAVSQTLAAIGDKTDATGWKSRSAFLTAPTFGGNSWLTHASFLSGRAVRTHDAYETYLHVKSERLVERLHGQGYRTVLLTPAIRGVWPEGQQLGFDEILTLSDLAYDGPEFGFWHIPDQVSLDLVADTEFNRPCFVVFPTVMSHFPFGPTPPYVADWSRLESQNAFAPDAVEASIALGDAVTGDRHDAYRRSIVYNLEVAGGFAANRAPENAIIVALGDHQPPALISGDTESWDVPVHVFARDDDTLAPFAAAGFAAGTMPSGESLGGVEMLTDLLLQALEMPQTGEPYARLDADEAHAP